MNVLITGVAGFSAYHLIQRLGSEKYLDLFGMDIYESAPAAMILKDYLEVDMKCYGQVLKAVRTFRPEWIFNLAGLTRGTSIELYGINMMGSIHLLEAVRQTVPACRVLLVGSAAEYGIHPESVMPVTEDTVCMPLEAYGISKYAMTMAANFKPVFTFKFMTRPESLF